MRYRLYIYKSTAIAANALAIGICNRAVSFYSLCDWEGNGAANYMANFDTIGTAARIRALVKENG